MNQITTQYVTENGAAMSSTSSPTLPQRPA